MWSHNKGVVTVKEWLKSVLNYRSYPKNKTKLNNDISGSVSFAR